jgi:hypothetical protein
MSIVLSQAARKLLRRAVPAPPNSTRVARAPPIRFKVLFYPARDCPLHGKPYLDRRLDRAAAAREHRRRQRPDDRELLSEDEWLGILHLGLIENSARFHPKIIVVEGLNCWGAVRAQLIDALERLDWRREGDHWQAPAGVPFEIAYRDRCAEARPAPGMARDNMQPLMDGSYPEGEIWF